MKPIPIAGDEVNPIQAAKPSCRVGERRQGGAGEAATVFSRARFLQCSLPSVKMGPCEPQVPPLHEGKPAHHLNPSLKSL